MTNVHVSVVTHSLITVLFNNSAASTESSMRLSRSTYEYEHTTISTGKEVNNLVRRGEKDTKLLK
jgi:hypothetical protein